MPKEIYNFPNDFKSLFLESFYSPILAVIIAQQLIVLLIGDQIIRIMNNQES